jgi:hypothetical protein
MMRTRPRDALDVPVALPQHPHEHRPKPPILLAVDQELGEGAGLGVSPELADPVGSLEVGERQDVEQLGAGSGTEGVEPLSERRTFSGSDGIVRTLPWSADDIFGDAGHSATGVEGPRTKTKGWGTDLVPVPQPFGSRRGCQGEGPGRGVPCFRAHDETVAIA